MEVRGWRQVQVGERGDCRRENRGELGDLPGGVRPAADDGSCSRTVTVVTVVMVPERAADAAASVEAASEVGRIARAEPTRGRRRIRPSSDLRRPEPAQDELQRRRARVRQHAHRALPRRHRRRRRARLGGARVRKRAPVLRRRSRRRRRQLGAAHETAEGVGGDGASRAGATVRREPPQDPRSLPHLRDELLAQPRDERGETRERRSRSRRRVDSEIVVFGFERGKAIASALLRQRELRRHQRGANRAVRALHPRRGRRGGYRRQPARRAVRCGVGGKSPGADWVD